MLNTSSPYRHFGMNKSSVKRRSIQGGAETAALRILKAKTSPSGLAMAGQNKKGWVTSRDNRSVLGKLAKGLMGNETDG
jgi:hypothetical protein